MIPFADLVYPLIGDVIDVRPTSSGHTGTITAVVASEKGDFFVKGVPNRPGGRLDSARREAQVNPFVRDVCPTMHWQVEDTKWFVLGFEVIEGRPADFLPSSSDLPRVVDALNRVGALSLPPMAQDWAETRWDRFTTEEERDLLTGTWLTYTDLHDENVLLAEDRTWLIDWAWPTLGAAAITPSCWAVQLIAADHSPESAEHWVSQCAAWKASTPKSIAAFAQANVRLHEWQIQARPEEKWLEAMLDAAKAWHQHLKG